MLKNPANHHLQSLSSENKTSHLLEASFSSYLSSNDEEAFKKKLTDSSRNLNPFREDDLLHMVKKKEEDGEIGVFSAEKYFNGGIVDSPRVPNMPARKVHHHHHHQKEKQEADKEEEPRKIKAGTPSIRSESSWNSQSALLKSAMKNSSRNDNNKKVKGKSFLANLGCKCYCSDKDSVDISSNTSGEICFSKNSSFGMVPEKTKTTPKKIFKTVSSSGLENQLVKMHLQEEEEEEAKARKSLEVFGSPILENRSKSMSFDKRHTIITVPIVASPKMQEEMDLSANSGGNYINDAASDASSDLFEIESLTGAIKSNPYLARQTSDATHNSGCLTPTTCYAPSEASIEWSVVTASAAEYSVMSDCDEQRSVATIRSPIRLSSFGASTNVESKGGSNNRDIQRRRAGNLLGCKSHKAVRVAGDAFLRCEKSSSSPHKLHQVTKTASYGTRHGQLGFANSQPMQRSHSPLASQFLYT